MLKPYEEIIKLLTSSGVEYKLFEHQPVKTSEEAAKIRGLSMHEGAKCLLLSAEGKFVICIIPGDARLDTKKVKKLLHVKDVRFANPQEVITVMGCEIGACYPITTIINSKPFVDATLAENEFISFNPGVHDKSIRMKWSDYNHLVQPEMVDIIRES